MPRGEPRATEGECIICHEVKPYDAFPMSVVPGRRMRMCSQCRDERMGARADNLKFNKRSAPSKRCKRCKRSFEIYSFARLKDGSRSGICRACKGAEVSKKPITEEEAEMLLQRPVTRADCVDGPRPCPWVSCRHHLWVDVSKTGKLTYRPGDEDTPSCALDVADRGGIDGGQTARMMGVTRARIEQNYRAAMAKVAKSKLARELGPPGVSGETRKK
jgi:hypothetical protein